jgi:hypothetical protein
MITTKVLRGLSILAFVFVGFTTGIAGAAPNAGAAASAAGAACQLLAPMPEATVLTHMTGTYLPGLSGSSCMSADAAAPIRAASASSGACALIDDSQLTQMTGTYLPGLSGNSCP